jgi:hypothetical protein
MQIGYQLSEKDFVEAYAAHCSKNPSLKWNRAISYGCLVLVLGAFIFYAIARNPPFNLTSYLPLLALAVMWFVIIRYYARWTVRKQFRNQPGAHGSRTVTFDTDGAHWRWDGGSSDIAWKNYTRWSEGKNQILFYTSPACFNILPTQGLSSEQVTEIRELLKQNIQPAK